MRGKHYLDLSQKKDSFQKIEKIKKEKRSLRGRIEDDWLLLSSDPLKLEKNIKDKNYCVGRVIEVQKKHIFIAEEEPNQGPKTEDLWLCTIAKRHFQRAHKERNFVVVGDLILFAPNEDLKLDDTGQPIDTDLPRGVIQHAFPRRSKISRRDPLHPEWEHTMLANIDLIAVVASVQNPEVRFGLLDRFLVLSEWENIPAILILNKTDLLDNEKLCTPDFLETYKRRISEYKKIGYKVFEVSSLHPKKTKDALRELKALFKGKIVGFSGHSGVGKSSIVNLMKPEFEQIVDENPDIFYKGRHTTTYNSLLQLKIGAYAIDTPGIRSFQIETFSPTELSSCFPEFKPFHCKYRECAHDAESPCAVKDALSQGIISKERYRSYIGLLRGVSLREGEAGESTDDKFI